ncbi:MAG: SCO family protein [Bacteroidia bacterium]|nr:SCO family protein [Bacteroidia bacterium]
MKISKLAGIALLLSACSEPVLPILGPREVEVKQVNGKEVVDTIYKTIPDFSFYNQDGDIITKKDVMGKIYVADFFFVTCPTICPRMKRNLLKVYEAYGNEPNVMLLSHTIDPDHDSISVLKEYAEGLGAKAPAWHFLRAEREYTWKLAEEGYYATAMADSLEPGGFVHSGGLILVDQLGRVRGVYDGTSESETKQLINDIPLLLHEKKD